MKLKRHDFGMLSTGDRIDLFILESPTMKIGVTNYGAILTSVLLPAKNGEWDDVTLGFSALSGYTAKHPFFGATAGRFANRIGKARFPLNGKEYALAANNGENHLHGGNKGFDRKIWRAETREEGQAVFVRLSVTSPDGDEGYPGRLEVSTTYSLDSRNRISVSWEARTDAPTPVNLTNHSYFNLKGEGRGDILAHELRLSASGYIPVGADLIPTGEIGDVSGGPFDFRRMKTVGKDIAAVAGGYDHCFVLDAKGDLDVPSGEVFEPETGRRMRFYTTMPGVQFYSGNFLSDIRGKNGSIYNKHAGFCLETEYFPDSPNQGSFPSCILEPGKEYKHATVYEFL